MKVIDKSDREILLDLMKLPSNIKEYDVDEQYFFIHVMIDTLERSIFKDDYILDHSNYDLSNIQDEAYQNALKYYQVKDYYNVYLEIVKFIKNDGKKDNRKIYEIEMKNIKSILVGINKKIKETTNLAVAFNKLVDKLNINSNFGFWIGDGSVSPMHKDKYKSFELNNEQINIDWFGIENTIQDKNVINQIKEIIITYKKELYDFYDRQKDENGEFPSSQLLIGTYNDECSGIIDSLKFQVCNRFQHPELNKFYENFKHELFEIIEKNISKEHIDDIKESEINVETNKSIKDMYNNTNENINTNTEKDINEKYNGISGIVSIKNMLIH